MMMLLIACVSLATKSERGIIRWCAFSARAICVVAFLSRLKDGNIIFRVALDTLNTKSSKKYETFAPSAALPEREEEL
jgi:hypothetical protein